MSGLAGGERGPTERRVEMNPHELTVPTEDEWERGDLGRDENFVRRSPPEREDAVDDALELQMISIRLQKELIRALKAIADYHGIGYQPLMRDILARFSRVEMLRIHDEMKQQLDEQKTQQRA
jgi:hypothetical protein